jgi:hypothetical protein
LTDPGKAAADAERRAERARVRAVEAQRRLAELFEHRLRDPQHRDLSRSVEAAREAEERDKSAREAARETHKLSADLHEERASELAATGEYDAATRAEQRADAAREREDRGDGDQ